MWQKLQQYDEVLTQAMQHEYPLGEEIRAELRRFQAVLGLGDDDVTAIEARIVNQIAAVHRPARQESKIPPEEQAFPPGPPQESIEKESATGVRPNPVPEEAVAAPCQATSIEVMDVLEYRRLRQLSVGGLILTFGGIISIGVAAEAPLGYLLFLVGVCIMGYPLLCMQRRQMRTGLVKAPPHKDDDPLTTLGP